MIIANDDAFCFGVVSKDNEKDIEEIPTSVRKGVEIITVSRADEVLRESLYLVILFKSVREELCCFP